MVKSNKTFDLIVIGRKDIASFPAIGAENIPVKVDTGAYTSSMHCDEIQLIDNQLHVTFSNLRYPIAEIKTLVFDHFKTKKVKSSNGVLQERFFIQMPIVIFGQEIECQFSLTHRAAMKFPILLGRKFLKKRFIVDVSKTGLSTKKKLTKIIV
jgi:hypothetical protein